MHGSPEMLFADLQSRPYAFWLDSAGGASDVARWSFLGAEPQAILDSRNGWTTLETGGEVFGFPADADPLVLLRSLLHEVAILPQPGWPPFVGGAVGWFGYDLARREMKIPALAEDDTALPEMRLAFYPAIFAYLHATRQLWRIRRTDGMEISPDWIQRQGGVPPSFAERESYRPAPLSPTEGLRPETFVQETYGRAVLRIQDYIAAGDIYQANLTQRFAQRCPDFPADLYLRLREINPSPFAAYLGFDDVAVLSASPERFLSVDALTRRVETRPIKGTRRRSSDPAEDLSLKEELIRSAKDRAENLMIVDVHRNDLGRVCEYGSVNVPALWQVESYATVHHLVSVVEGRLRAELSPVDLIRAAFPAGSITGAPKLRAMQIIEEMEPVRRGIYTGAIGYLGWDGSMDLSVAIRTLVAQGGGVDYGVGGGIVADSSPEAEYQETLDKALALRQALEPGIGLNDPAPRFARTDAAHA